MLQRSIVMSVVVIAHLGLFKLPWVNHPKQQPAVFESIVVLLSDKALPPEPSKDSVKGIGPPSPATPPVEVSKSDNPEPMQPSSTNEQKASTPQEWRAAKEAAIRLAAKTATAAPAFRLFGKPIQKPQPTPEPKTIFDEPKHRFGDITETPEGDSIVWLSENCYQITNSDVAHFIAFARGVPDTTKTHVWCSKSIGTPPPNSHLFDDLKREAATAR